MFWQDCVRALASHFLRRGYPEERQAVGQRLPHRRAQRQARGAQRLVLDQDALGIIVAVEFARERAQVESDRVRRELAGGAGDGLRKFGQPLRELQFLFAGQRVERAAGELGRVTVRSTARLRELAGEFHSYYNAERILVEDEALRLARLALCAAVRQTLANGLSLLGVSAPEKM